MVSFPQDGLYMSCLEHIITPGITERLQALLFQKTFPVAEAFA